MPIQKPTTSFFKTHFHLILLLSLLSYAHANLELIEKRPPERYPITTTTPHLSIELDYPKAFDVTIEAFNKLTDQKGFCYTHPSGIFGKLLWNGPMAFSHQNPGNNAGTEFEELYDNIVQYKDFYFLLDSVSFKIIVTKELTVNSTTAFVAIESDIQNDVTNGLPEDAYLIVDPDIEILYVITRKTLLFYSIKDFLQAIKDQQPIPRITKNNKAPNYKGYDNLMTVEYHQQRLYIVADTIMDVFVLSPNGEITPHIQFNADYFAALSVSLTDIAFKGHYAFILDKLKGVYVIDLANQDKVAENDVRNKYWFQADMTLEVPKGQFIEVIGDSLNVISSTTGLQYIHEFIIIGDPNLLRFEPNRKLELYQAVRDTFVDDNFLYLLTGFFNMATKHSIPGRYESDIVQNTIVEYWPLFGTRTMISKAQNQTSEVIAIQDGRINIYSMQEKNPIISCDMNGVAGGLYTYSLKAVQKNCPAKANDPTSDYNTVCVIKQDIELLVIKESATIGNPVQSKMTVLFLLIGIGVMVFIVIIFIYLFRKYKSQYLKLEDQVKFQKLEEDNSDQNTGSRDSRKKGKGKDDQDIDPKNINIGIELEKS